jgi:hypothetical protein
MSVRPLISVQSLLQDNGRTDMPTPTGGLQYCNATGQASQLLTPYSIAPTVDVTSLDTYAVHLLPSMTSELSVGLKRKGNREGGSPIPDVISLTKLAAGRSQLPCGLKRDSAVARLLGLRVPVPPGAWMSVSCECCVLSGTGLCVRLITRPEETYRVWCV